MAVDQDKLNELLGRFVVDFGAAWAAGNIAIGHRLGLFRALAEGPATPEELADRTGTNVRYVTEWLYGQAAGGYVEWRPDTGTFALSEEQAFALTDPDGPLYLPTAFVGFLGAMRAEPQIVEAFRTGGGFGWHEHHEDMFVGVDAFFRPKYVANLMTSWIPTLDGVQAKLQDGARVADVGCGLGSSTVLLAQAYPASTFVGSDYHAASIELARKQAAESGVTNRVSFEVESAQTFTGRDYDLIATLDCLHDMGDPLGAARRIREALRADGTWLLVEPFANDTVAGNLNPVGRLFYSVATFLCLPSALSQPGGYALGPQAGEAAMRQLATDAGFTRFRRATETPFNIVYEVRP